jgi:hypothetical protein
MTETEPQTPVLPPKYASYNSRMFASFIDLGIVMCVADPLVEWLTQLIFAPVDDESFQRHTMGLATEPDVRKIIATLYDFVREQHIIERFMVQNVLVALCIAAYTLPFWLRYSSTPGKLLFRQHICDEETRQAMSRRQCFIRFGGYILSAIPLTFGFIWIALNRKRRGWHDMLAHTIVEVKPRKPKKPKVEAEPVS